MANLNDSEVNLMWEKSESKEQRQYGMKKAFERTGVKITWSPKGRWRRTLDEVDAYHRPDPEMPNHVFHDFLDRWVGWNPRLFSLARDRKTHTEDDNKRIRNGRHRTCAGGRRPTKGVDGKSGVIILAGSVVRISGVAAERRKQRTPSPSGSQLWTPESLCISFSRYIRFVNVKCTTIFKIYKYEYIYIYINP